MTANYVEFDGKEYDCAFARYITARKKAEAEIAHLSSFPESTPWPLLEFGRDCRVRYANSAALAAAELDGGGDLRVLPAAEHRRSGGRTDGRAEAAVVR